MDYATERRASKAFVALDGRPLGHRRDVLCQMRVEPAFSPPLQDLEEEEELVCPVEFSGRGSKPSGSGRKELINYTEGRSSAACVAVSTTSTRAAGCRPCYHRAVAQARSIPSRPSLRK